MKPWISRITLIGLLLGTLGCASAGSFESGRITVMPESFGAFECVDRGLVASPPPRGILPLGIPCGEDRQVRRRQLKPLLTIRLCPEGKVPVAKATALPTVAKGNPLLGRIDRPVGDFFKGAEMRELKEEPSAARQGLLYPSWTGPQAARHTRGSACL